MRTLARTPHKTDLADLSARKRMSSGELPGLQNRRAASLMSPVRSTRTRFRQFILREMRLSEALSQDEMKQRK